MGYFDEQNKRAEAGGYNLSNAKQATEGMENIASEQKKAQDTWYRENLGLTLAQEQKLSEQDFLYNDGRGNNPYEDWFNKQKNEAASTGQNFGWKSWQQALYYGTVGQEGYTNPETGNEHRATFGDWIAAEDTARQNLLKEYSSNLANNGYTGNYGAEGADKFYSIAQFKNFEKDLSEAVSKIEIPDYINAIDDARSDEQLNNIISNFEQFNVGNEEDYTYAKKILQSRQDSVNLRNIQQSAQIEQLKAASTAQYWNTIMVNPSEIFNSDQYKILQAETSETGSHYISWMNNHKAEIMNLGEDAVREMYMTSADGYNSRVAETASTFALYGRNGFTPSEEQYASMMGYTLSYSGSYGSVSDDMWNANTYDGTAKVYTDANGAQITEAQFKSNYDNYMYEITDKYWADEHGNMKHYKPDELQTVIDGIDSHLKYWYAERGRSANSDLTAITEEEFNIGAEAEKEIQRLEALEASLREAHNYDTVTVSGYTRFMATFDMYTDRISRWYMNTFAAPIVLLDTTFDAFGMEFAQEGFGNTISQISDQIIADNQMFSNTTNNVISLYNNENTKWALELGLSAVDSIMDMGFALTLGASGVTGLKAFDSEKYGQIGARLLNFVLPTGTGGLSLMDMWGRVFTTTFADMNAELAKYTDAMGNRTYSVQDVWLYALESAFTEFYTEKIFGTILSPYSNGTELLSGLSEKLAAKSTTMFGKNLIRLAAEMVGEGLEEVLSEYADPLWRAQLFGTSYSAPSASDVAKAFAGGALTSLVTGGTKMATAVFSDVKVEELAGLIKQSNEGTLSTEGRADMEAKIQAILNRTSSVNHADIIELLNAKGVMDGSVKAGEFMEVLDAHLSSILEQSKNTDYTAEDILKANETFVESLPKAYGQNLLNLLNKSLLRTDANGVPVKNESGKLSIRSEIIRQVESIKDSVSSSLADLYLTSIAFPQYIFENQSMLELYQTTHTNEEFANLANQMIKQAITMKSDNLNPELKGREQLKDQREAELSDPAKIYQAGQYRALNIVNDVATGKVEANKNGIILEESQASDALGIKVADEMDTMFGELLEDIYTEDIAVLDFNANRQYIQDHAEEITKSVTTAITDGFTFNGKHYVFAGYSASQAKSNGKGRAFRIMLVEESRFAEVAPVLMGKANYNLESVTTTNGWDFAGNKANLNKFFVYSGNAWSGSKTIARLNDDNFIMIPDVEGEAYTENRIGYGKTINNIYKMLSQVESTDKITDGTMYMIVDGPVNGMTTQQVRGGVGFKGNLVPVSLDGILSLMDENGVDALGKDINGYTITKADLIQRVKSSGELYIAPESVVKLSSQYKTEDGKYDMKSMYETLKDKAFALRAKNSYDSKHEENIAKIQKLSQMLRGQSYALDSAKEAISSLGENTADFVFDYLSKEADTEKIQAMFDIIGIKSSNNENAIREILSDLFNKGDLTQLNNPVLRGMIRSRCEDLVANAKGGRLYVMNTRCSLDRVCRDPYAVMERMMLQNEDISDSENMGYLKDGEMIVPTVEGEEGVAWRYPVQTGKNTVAFTRAQLDEKMQKLYPKDTIVEAYRSAAQHILDADYDGDTYAFTMSADLIKLLKATQEELKSIPLINFDHAKKGAVEISNMEQFTAGVVDAVRAALTANDLTMYDNWINAVYSTSLNLKQKQQYAAIFGLGYIMCIDQVKTGIGIGNIEEMYKANPTDETLKSMYYVKNAIDIAIKDITKQFKKDFGVDLSGSAVEAVSDKVRYKAMNGKDNIYTAIANSVKEASAGQMKLEQTKDMTNPDFLKSIRYNSGRYISNQAINVAGAMFIHASNNAQKSSEVAELYYKYMSDRGVTDKQVAFDYMMTYIQTQVDKANKAVTNQSGEVVVFGKKFASYSDALGFTSSVVENLGYQFNEDVNNAYQSTQNTLEVNFADYTEAAKQGSKFQKDLFKMLEDKDYTATEIIDTVVESLDEAVQMAVINSEGEMRIVKKSEAEMFDYGKLDIIKADVKEWRNSTNNVSHLVDKMKADSHGTGNSEVCDRVFSGINYLNKTAEQLTKQESIDLMAKIARFSQSSVEQTVIISGDVYRNSMSRIGTKKNDSDIVSVNQCIDYRAENQGDLTKKRIKRLLESPLQPSTMMYTRFGCSTDTGIFLEDACKKVDSNINRANGNLRNIANALDSVQHQKELLKTQVNIKGVNMNGETVTMDGTVAACVYSDIERAVFQFEEGSDECAIELLDGHYIADSYDDWQKDKVREVVRTNPELDALLAKREHQSLTDAEQARIHKIVEENIPALKAIMNEIADKLGNNQSFVNAIGIRKIFSARTCPLLEDAQYRNYGNIRHYNSTHYVPYVTRRTKSNINSKAGAYDVTTQVSNDRTGNFGANHARRGGTVSYNLYTLMETYCAEMNEHYYNCQWADEISKLYNVTSAKGNKLSIKADTMMDSYIRHLRGMDLDTNPVTKVLKSSMNAVGSFFANVHLQYSIGAVTAQHASYHQGHEALSNYLWVKTDKDGKIAYSKIGEFVTTTLSKLDQRLQEDIGYNPWNILKYDNITQIEKLGIDTETGEYQNNIVSYLSDFLGRFGTTFDRGTALQELAHDIQSLGMEGIQISDRNTTYRLTEQCLKYCIVKCAEVNNVSVDEVYDIIKKQDRSTKAKEAILKDFNYNYNHCMEAVMQSQPHNTAANSSALQRFGYSSIAGQYKTQPFINLDSVVRGIAMLSTLDSNDTNADYAKARALGQLKGGVTSLLHSALEFGIIKTLFGRLTKGKRKKWVDENGELNWNYVMDSITSFGLQSMYNSIPFVGTIFANMNAYEFNKKYGLYNNYLAKTNENGMLQFFDENGKLMEYGKDYYSTEDAYNKNYDTKFAIGKSFAGEFGIASNTVDAVLKIIKGVGDVVGEDGLQISDLKNIDFTNYDQQQAFVLLVEIASALATYGATGNVAPIPLSSFLTDADKIKFLKDDLVGLITGDNSKYVTTDKASDALYSALNELIGKVAEETVTSFDPIIQSNMSESSQIAMAEYEQKWIVNYRNANDGNYPRLDSAKQFNAMLMDAYNDNVINASDMQKMLDSFYEDELDSFDITSGKSRPDRTKATDLINNPIYSKVGKEWGLTLDSSDFYINAYKSGSFKNAEEAYNWFYSVNPDGGQFTNKEAGNAVDAGLITSQSQLDMMGYDSNTYDILHGYSYFFNGGADSDNSGTMTQAEMLAYLDDGGEYNPEELKAILTKNNTSTTSKNGKQLWSYANKSYVPKANTSYSVNTPSVAVPNFDYSIPNF